MKTTKYLFTALMALMFVYSVDAQQPEMQNFRQPDKDGIQQFEAPKDEETEFEGVKVRVGGGMALQFQGVKHWNDANNLVRIGNNFNLATANLDLDVQLFSGVRMHLRTYLSSRHHAEAWVKGGYLQIDRLDFISEGFLGGLMDKVRIKIGHMENNYGDAHFRRTDNGTAIYNPFVGNYILDAFTTEVGGEIYYFHNGIIGMVGMTNGRLNQNVLAVNTKPAFLAKFGYDNQDEDLRLRLTGSVYHVLSTTNTVNLYAGDRAGARYYRVMQLGAPGTPDDFRSGRFNPAMSSEMTSIMINPFIKAGGLEFFGLAEFISGRNNTADAAFEGKRSWTHIGAELLYRFGSEENLYLGGRYNTASGQLPGQETDKVSINRFNIGGGWFMTKNILTKLEYVNQQYKDFADARFGGGKFSGLMIEAAISF